MNSLAQDIGYAQLKNRLIASTGLAFYADRDERLTELIAGRLADLGLRDCSAYARFLAAGGKGRGEMDALIAQLTIGETYFFRDEAQFAAIRDTVLPDILERNKSSRRMRIWSAGCANGAEPYSLAILLERELAGRTAGWDIHIYGTDLNREALAQAAAGTFREWAFRATSGRLQHECFSQEGLLWSIQPRFKERVSFHRMNLVDGEFSTRFAAGVPFDLILCRNVMIYFAPEVNRRLIGNLHNSLTDGGWLMVGASECSQEDFKAFRGLAPGGTALYQKAPPRGPVAAVPQAAAAMVVEARSLASLEAEALIKPPVALVLPDLEGLRQLTGRGDWRGAAAYGQNLLRLDVLNAEVHFQQALISEKLGMPADSERWLRQAIYLDRNFALAHYRLGLALRRHLAMPAAARCFGNVLKILAGVPDRDAIKGGTGVTVPGLKELARERLRESCGS